MKPMKTLKLGVTQYEVTDEVARSQGGGGDEPSVTEYNRVNVRDYGAVGDGVTDDRGAIIAAFDKAKTMLPCEVYFPAGTYAIDNGITVEMAYGTGGLRVHGAGRDVTTIKYSERYDPDQSGNMWYAIRIWSVGMPDTKPTNENDYLHDISISGLTVYDPDPIAHAWHPDKGDPNKEETHGFDIQCCKRVSVTDCNIITAGDECIDICYCHDVVVMNNHIVGSPAAGTSGGAISIGDGCNGVVVSGNTVNGSAEDETLEDGTVLVKRNFGVAVESLFVPVRNVVIANNVITNVRGNGINFGATNAGSGLYNISVANNIVQGCSNGAGVAGTHPKEGVTIANNTFADCSKLGDNGGNGIYLNSAGFVSLSIRDNIIRNTDAVGIYVKGIDTLIEGNSLENVGAEAVYVIDSAIIRDCTIKNTGLNGVGNGAISGFTNASVSVCGCKLTGVRQSKGITNVATEVADTTIEMVDADGNRIVTVEPIDCDYLKRLVNCQIDGYIDIKQGNAIVQGVTLNCGHQYQPAIKVSANGVIVTGCNINHTLNKDAIAEQTGYNHNLFANNVVNRPITTVGAQSVAANNIDTRTTA